MRRQTRRLTVYYIEVSRSECSGLGTLEDGTPVVFVCTGHAKSPCSRAYIVEAVEGDHFIAGSGRSRMCGQVYGGRLVPCVEVPSGCPHEVLVNQWPGAEDEFVTFAN